MDEQETLLLENDQLQVRVLPALGGKIVSLRSVRTDEEFLLPPLKAWQPPPAFAGFHESDGGGFDECLPSVSSCEGAHPVPDHGDLWRIPWHIDSDGDGIVLHADASSRPLRFTRRASLDGSSLLLEYSVFNVSDSPTEWLWSAHPLLQVEVGDRIVLPPAVRDVRIEYSTVELDKNVPIPWPVAISATHLPLDLSLVGPKDGRTAHKLFANMGQSGCAALYRARIGQALAFHFDPSLLPFLGVWISSGAWPETGDERQYTVALEPTTSNTDSLITAKENRTARILKAGERCEWWLKIELLGSSEAVSLEEVLSAL